MAKKPKNGMDVAPQTPEPIDPKHNAAARSEINAACATEMAQIKTERQALNGRAQKVRKRLRDAGMSVEAFDYAQKVAERETKDRTAYLEAVAEQFKMRDIGFQAEMFHESGDPAGDDDDPRPAFLKEQTEGKETAESGAK